MLKIKKYQYNIGTKLKYIEKNYSLIFYKIIDLNKIFLIYLKIFIYLKFLDKLINIFFKFNKYTFNMEIMESKAKVTF